jgi:hypothetical protein
LIRVDRLLLNWKLSPARKGIVIMHTCVYWHPDVLLYDFNKEA